jgi:ribosomal protein S18 acetylase RimI-like enzyme
MILVSHLVDDVRSRQFEQLYQIYARSLPSREQKSRAQIEALISRADYAVLAVEDEGQVIGFAIVQQSRMHPIALLEYMATDATRRGSGIGAHVFREVVTLVGSRTIIVEADSEREPDAADLPIRIRRINFYRRLGCRQLIDLPYILPLPGAGDPPLMDLLVFRNDMPASLAKTEVKQWLEAIYVDVYAQAADDARIDTMLKPIHGDAIAVG